MRWMPGRTSSGLVLLAFAAGCASSPAATGFLDRSLMVDGTTYRYVVFVPEHAPRNLPIVLFLHGAGERGADGLKQTQVGLGTAIRWNRDRFPMIAVFPQARENSRWLGPDAVAAMRALDQSIAEFDADRDRVYLTGLSMGGYGTWHLAMQYPDRFAAIVPICGGILKPPTAESVRQSPLTEGAADPYAATAERVKHLPVWIFHGAEDKVIPASESRRMYEELQRLGADVRYTELPGVGHNAWDPAYSQPDLWSWLVARLR